MGVAASLAADTGLRRVLFLCTANYYRSRFCEELFNHGAARERLPWHGFSRALHAEPAALNHGPMSPLALDFLHKQRIRPVNSLRLPLAVTAFDWRTTERVIAVHAAEHRPLVGAAWPEHASRVEYWNVGDLDVTPPRVALPALVRRIDALLDELARNEPTGRARGGRRVAR